MDECNRRPNDWDQVLFATVLQRGGRGGKLSADRLKPMFKTKVDRVKVSVRVRVRVP